MEQVKLQRRKGNWDNEYCIEFPCLMKSTREHYGLLQTRLFHSARWSGWLSAPQCSTIMVKFYEKLWLLKKITNYWHLKFFLLIAPKRGWHLCAPHLDKKKMDNMKQPVAILVLPVFSRIFQYLQYWYNKHFPESSIICNTGITSISHNLPVYLQYSYFGNDQYLLVLQILENSGRYWDTSIYQYLYQYCRYWKILVKYW